MPTAAPGDQGYGVGMELPTGGRWGLASQRPPHAEGTQDPPLPLPWLWPPSLGPLIRSVRVGTQPGVWAWPGPRASPAETHRRSKGTRLLCLPPLRPPPLGLAHWGRSGATPVSLGPRLETGLHRRRAGWTRGLSTVSAAESQGPGTGWAASRVLPARRRPHAGPMGTWPRLGLSQGLGASTPCPLPLHARDCPACPPCGQKQI